MKGMETGKNDTKKNKNKNSTEHNFIEFLKHQIEELKIESS